MDKGMEKGGQREDGRKVGVNNVERCPQVPPPPPPTTNHHHPYLVNSTGKATVAWGSKLNVCVSIVKSGEPSMVT